MPLKKTKRNGVWYLTGTVNGERIRESTGISEGNAKLAEGARVKREHELMQRSIHGERGLVTFAEAAASYLDASARSPATGAYVTRLLQHFGPNTQLKDIGQVALDRAYRAILCADAKGATKQRAVRTPMTAIMQHAQRRGWCDVPAFEAPNTRDSDTRTTYLLPAQAVALIQSATALEHRTLFTWLIGTGTRAGEAFDLEWKDVDLHGARAVVRQKQGNMRQVNLPPVVIAALASLPHREGHVFRPAPRVRHGITEQAPRYPDTGRQSGGQAQGAFATACQRAGLPGRYVQAAAARYWQPDLHVHDLRHTWASAHYAIHKDAFRLMAEGGWQKMEMVQRYTHLMPDAYVPQWKAWLAGGVAEARRTA